MSDVTQSENGPFVRLPFAEDEDCPRTVLCYKGDPELMKAVLAAADMQIICLQDPANVKELRISPPFTLPLGEDSE